MNAADIIEKAADIMQERGKASEVLQDTLGHVCTLGALCVATGNRADHLSMCLLPRRLLEPIAAFTGRSHPSPHDAIAKWSDENGQSVVVAGLRAVAATLRAQQAAPVYAEMES